MLNTQSTLNDYGISLNQPLYVYQCPMFLLTVSTVLVMENGVIMIEKDGVCNFPGGIVKAGKETIQFAAIRYIKEQLGITLRKEALIPVDYRSSPERSKEGNVVDIGMVCLLEGHKDIPQGAKWIDVDFENQKAVKNIKFYMDHDILLERALGVVLMVK